VDLNKNKDAAKLLEGPSPVFYDNLLINLD
jgi:hypothetical protein